ncbi:hypothetical protein C8F01DRAFT_1169797 [Mycena amicta]|nr:hypothetical protein C8F01DRAFT_1169797 [Mycena amicta]
MKPWDDIPPELFDEIAQRCSQVTLAALCRVSRTSQYIAEPYLYRHVEFPHPRRPREIMDRILCWSHVVLANQHLALQLYSLYLGSRRAEELSYQPASGDARQDSAHLFNTALRRCVNLKQLHILMSWQLPISVWDIGQRLLNNVDCPFRLTHLRSKHSLGIQAAFHATQKDLQVVSLAADDTPWNPNKNSLENFRSHALVAVHASGQNQWILPAESTSWKLQRAFIPLKTPGSDMAVLATYANTLQVLTIQRTRGLGLRLDALIALIASHLPLLLRLNIIEAEPSDARRNEGLPQDALLGFTALESLVLQLKVALPDPPNSRTITARKNLPRHQVAFSHPGKHGLSETYILRDSDDPMNSVCKLAPCPLRLKEVVYRLFRAQDTLLRVELGVQLSRRGGGLHEEVMSCVVSSMMDGAKKVVGCKIARKLRFNAQEDFFES